MTCRDDAIRDCRDAFASHPTLLDIHLEMWEGSPPDEGHPDFNYWTAMNEIREKLHTDKCLLRDWKA